MATHVCNAYCRPAQHEHCDIVYSPDDGSIPQVYGRELGLVVTEVKPASEAPPWPALAPDMVQHLGARPAATNAPAWLVWWLEPAEHRRRVRARQAERRAAALARLGLTEEEVRRRERSL